MDKRHENNEAFLRVNPFLRDVGIPDDLRDIIFSIAHAGKYVAHSIRNGSLGYAHSENPSGEDQLALDVVADKIFCEHLNSTCRVGTFASEEQEAEVKITCSDGQHYAVAFDPLDGSSLVSANFAIGTIFGIYAGDQFLGKKGREMVAAGYILYGPRTLLVVATEKGMWEFTENGIGEFVLSRENIVVEPDAKYFAPGNLRALAERSDYEKLFLHWAKTPLTLRYSGGMVPDIHMIISKGSGIFCYPGHSAYPNGKLRLLYECAPFAYLIEKAGGVAKDEFGVNILDKEIKTLHHRSSILIGSKNEVEQALSFLNKK